MEFQTHILIFFVLLSCFLSSSLAYKFYVGGRDGWVLYPSESYSQWAERNRFQVNDTLVFMYKKWTNSMLVVNKDDYYNCNTKNPIKKLEEGDSKFQFDRSGPFFFITRKDQSCEKGHKLIVIVLVISYELSHCLDI
ncbi:early nodulin-like protein 1 [Juglans microcarpa x Juglans regia]|uniref:early nodulin-like protein 1 n=1 Tax=Juglans microcarpa x Juglans regia TaxID=2249226 RepID=UPI001B7E390B|nr:early nodulin-like protein 1 [Juglans microcarpa x Juglans regia]